MIDFQTARHIAASYIAGLTTRGSGGRLGLIDDLTKETAFGWVFFYDFQQYLETRDTRYQAIGNAPLIVDRHDGRVHPTGTSENIEHYIAEYEKEHRQHRLDVPRST